MSDPVREFIRACSGIDDPASAVDLPLPRLRFALAAGPPEDALGVAVERAASLVQLARGDLDLRVVCWGDAQPPLAEWFPGAPVTWDERPSVEGAPRRVATVRVASSAQGVRAALACALRGELELDLWLLSSEGVLLRPYDDRGVDVVAESLPKLRRFARAHPDWLLDAPPPEVRCTLAACDVAWDAMASTGRDDVRRCGGCQQDVYLAESPSAFEEHAAAGRCVALPLGTYPLHVLGGAPGGPAPGPPRPPQPYPMLAGMALPPRPLPPVPGLGSSSEPEGLFARLRRWFGGRAPRAPHD